jgi:hypothetical protein
LSDTLVKYSCLAGEPGDRLSGATCLTSWYWLSTAWTAMPKQLLLAVTGHRGVHFGVLPCLGRNVYNLDYFETLLKNIYIIFLI